MDIFHWTKNWAQQSNIEVISYPEVPSTNLIAHQYSYTSHDPILFLTAHQTQGKGRHQNIWMDSGAGTSLLSTWSFYLNHPPQPIASVLLGLALYKAAKQTWPNLAFSLKAPNDLFLEKNKVAGILIETLTDGTDHRMLVGIGLNVNSTPKEISHATSLSPFFSQPLTEKEWYTFLNAVLVEISEALAHCANEKISSQTQLEVIEALNQNPNLTEKYIRVDEYANLYTQNKRISWTEL